jgi:hypothetical protein
MDVKYVGKPLQLQVILRYTNKLTLERNPMDVSHVEKPSSVLVTVIVMNDLTLKTKQLVWEMWKAILYRCVLETDERTPLERNLMYIRNVGKPFQPPVILKRLNTHWNVITYQEAMWEGLHSLNYHEKLKVLTLQRKPINITY